MPGQAGAGAVSEAGCELSHDPKSVKVVLAVLAIVVLVGHVASFNSALTYRFQGAKLDVGLYAYRGRAHSRAEWVRNSQTISWKEHLRGGPKPGLDGSWRGRLAGFAIHAYRQIELRTQGLDARPTSNPLRFAITGPPSFIRETGVGFDLTFPLYAVSLVLIAYPTMALVLGGPLARRRRRRRGLCVQCSYDLTGNESGVCPECRTKVL